MSSAKPPGPQQQQYLDALRLHGAELGRFVSGYERDPAKRQELLQELQLALWQSLPGFRGQCSLRTWVYRVAHNVGASHVQRSLRQAERQPLDLDEAALLADAGADIAHTERRIDLERVLALIHQLRPLDRELMLLYLEDLDATSMADITGISARNVATKIHRIKALLARQLGVKE